MTQARRASEGDPHKPDAQAREALVTHHVLPRWRVGLVSEAPASSICLLPAWHEEAHTGGNRGVRFAAVASPPHTTAKSSHVTAPTPKRPTVPAALIAVSC